MTSVTWEHWMHLCTTTGLSLNWIIDRGVDVVYNSQLCFLSCWPVIMKILSQKFKLQKMSGFQAKRIQKQSWGWRLVCGWVSEEDQVTASTKKKLKQVGLFGGSGVIFICFQWNIGKKKKTNRICWASITEGCSSNAVVAQPGKPAVQHTLSS